MIFLVEVITKATRANNQLSKFKITTKESSLLKDKVKKQPDLRFFFFFERITLKGLDNCTECDEFQYFLFIYTFLVSLGCFLFNCIFLSSHFAPASSKEFLDMQATIVWIHSETRTWDDKKIQSNALYR